MSIESGQRVKQLRMKAQLTQKQLGDKLNVSKSTISAWEIGRMPDENSLILLCDIFNVSPNYFYGKNNTTQTKTSSKHPTRSIKFTPINTEKKMVRRTVLALAFIGITLNVYMNNRLLLGITSLLWIIFISMEIIQWFLDKNKRYQLLSLSMDKKLVFKHVLEEPKFIIKKQQNQKKLFISLFYFLLSFVLIIAIVNAHIDDQQTLIMFVIFFFIIIGYDIYLVWFESRKNYFKNIINSDDINHDFHLIRLNAMVIVQTMIYVIMSILIITIPIDMTGDYQKVLIYLLFSFSVIFSYATLLSYYHFYKDYQPYLVDKNGEQKLS